MWKRLRRALTSRTSVIAQLLAMTAALGIAAVVPQADKLEPGSGAGEAAVGPRTPGPVVEALGLDRVFTTPWFAALAGLFAVTLVLSTFDQWKVSLGRVRALPPEGGREGEPSPRSAAEVEAILEAEGFRRLSARGATVRYGKRWQGWFGNFFLHAGMTVAVVFSVIYALTESRASAHLVSGQPLRLEPGRYAQRRGLLAREMPLPAEMHLYRVEPTFGAGDKLVDLASHLVLTDPDGTSRELRVAVNDLQSHRGVVVYQLVKYGAAFALDVEGGGEPTGELVLEFPPPATRGAQTYANRALPSGRLLKAKYVASADRQKLWLDDPVLTLRLMEGEAILGEVSLREGQAALLGPVSVRLLRAGGWTELLFEGSLGTSGIFAGFAVLLLGGGLAFFAVPREVLVRAAPGGATVIWRTGRFADFHRDERDRILARCRGDAA